MKLKELKELLERDGRNVEECEIFINGKTLDSLNVVANEKEITIQLNGDGSTISNFHSRDLPDTVFLFNRYGDYIGKTIDSMNCYGETKKEYEQLLFNANHIEEYARKKISETYSLGLFSFYNGTQTDEYGGFTGKWCTGINSLLNCAIKTFKHIKDNDKVYTLLDLTAEEKRLFLGRDVNYTNQKNQTVNMNIYMDFSYLLNVFFDYRLIEKMNNLKEKHNLFINVLFNHLVENHQWNANDKNNFLRFIDFVENNSSDGAYEKYVNKVKEEEK